MVAKEIYKHIIHSARGSLFSTKRFLAYGSRAAVDQALSRLAKKGIIMRVTRGVYVRPKENKYVGKVMPEPRKVAELLVRMRGERLEMHGAEAARLFGLSTQVSMQPVFYTTGRTRSFEMGNLNVTMRHRSASKLVFSGTLAGRAISALMYLGKENVTPHKIAAICKQLPEVELRRLENASPKLPIWLARLLQNQAYSLTSA